VNKDTSQLKVIRVGGLVGVSQMLNSVWSHVDVAWKRELVVDLASEHGYHVEIKALEVENKIVRDILQACPLHSIHVVIA
jgi:hypothetical protein